MPQIKSAKKRLKQNIARRTQNRAVKRTIRTLCRKVREAAAGGDAQEAQAELTLACKKLDQAGAKRVIHPNAAARMKSRLSARVKAAKKRQAPAQG